MSKKKNNKDKDVLDSSKMIPMEIEPFKGENLCQNTNCKFYGRKHRHMINECLDHMFCASPPMSGIDGTYKDLYEKLPQTLYQDHDETKTRAYKGQYSSEFIGYDHLLKTQNECGYFGHENQIPDDKKLIVTEETIDCWLAAHYGLQIHEVPSVKPAGMNKSIHNYVKITARKTRDLMKDMEKAQKKADQKGMEPEYETQQPVTAKDFGPMSGGVQYQVSPAKFEGVYLSKNATTMSYADKMIKFDEEQKNKKKRRRKANNDSDSESGSLSQPSSTSPSISTRGFNSAGGVKTKDQIPEKVIEDENEHNVSTHSYRNPQRFQTRPRNKYDAKISEERKYRPPDAYVKNRINSESLNFMNYQEIEKISKSNLSDMATKIEFSKQRRQNRSETNTQSQKQQHEEKQAKAQDQNQQKKSPQSVKQSDFHFKSPEAKAIAKKFEQKPEVNKRHINNLQKQRQNIQEMLKMFQVQQATVYNNVKHSKIDPKSQTAKINFSSFDFQQSGVKINNPRMFQKRADEQGQRGALSTSVSRQRPKTGVAASYSGQQRKLVSGFKSRTQAFSNQSSQDNRPANTTASLGTGPFSDSRRQNMTAQQFQNTDRIVETRIKTDVGRYSTNKHFKRADGSQTGKSFQSTAIYDGSNTNNFSSKPFMQSPISAGNANKNLRATTGKLLKPNVLINSSNFDEDTKAFLHSEVLSSRVTSSITNQDFLALLNKKQKDKKDLTNLSQLAQTAKKRLQAISSSSCRGGSKIKLNEPNPMRDSVSTKLRIKNEQVTSKILLDQQSLQQILTSQFSVRCSKVELPVYTQMQVLRNSKDLDQVVDRSIAPPEDIDKKQVSMFSDASIVRYSKIQKEPSQSKGPNQSVSQMENLTQEASMQRVTSGNVTFQNIKSNFGLQQDPSYHNVAARGMKGVNRKNLNTQSTKITKIEDKLDCVEQASPVREKGWTVPIKQPPGKDKHASKQEILTQHNQWLVQQVINALNDEVEKKGSTDKDTDDTNDLTQASVQIRKPSESVNVEIKLYAIDLTVSKVFKNFKDYKFWLQQSQIRKNHPKDWESAVDYLACGLRELPLEIKLLYNYASLNEKLARYDIALQFFDFCLEIRPRWTDALFGKAVTFFKLGKYKQSKKCVKTAIHNYKDDCFESLNVMQYFQAMCYKNLGKYFKAQRDYGALTSVFQHDEADQIKMHIIGCILLPLQTNRIEQHEFMENTLNLLTFFQKGDPLPPKDHPDRLETYVYQQGPKKGVLNMVDHGLQIYYRVQQKPFFRRFSKEYLLKYLGNAKVEYYKKGQIIFLKGQVAVINHGTVRVMSHQDGILTPTVIGKYGQGRILGHEESDGGITVNPQSWFITFDEEIELVIFDQKTFSKLWSLQSFKSSKLILESFLRQNLFWQNMSEQTKYHLIFESAEVRKYRPGQLIARVSKRSAVVTSTYGKYYKETSGKMKEQFESQKREDQADETVNKAMGQAVEEPSETVMSQYVVKLTKSSGGVPSNPNDKKNGKTGNKSTNNDQHLSQTNINSGTTTIDKMEIDLAQGEEKKSIHTAKKNSKDKGNTIGFKKELQKLKQIYKDKNYQEVDGIYFVYHGSVDIVNPGNRECMYSMGITDNFGESKILRRPTFEYMGDLYAGLHPIGQSPGKTLPNVPFFNRSVHLTQSIKLGNLELDERTPRTKIKDKISDEIKGQMDVQNLIPDDKIATVLNEDDDCVICIFIPYEQFFSVVPSHEIRNIKQCQELQSTKDGMINLFSTKYGFLDNELFKY